jgi:hypothetical protein
MVCTSTLTTNAVSEAMDPARKQRFLAKILVGSSHYRDLNDIEQRGAEQ